MQKTKQDRAYRLKSEKASHQQGINRQIWRVVDGAIRDAFLSHPDYLTKKGSRSACARRSIAKRVTGALLSYLGQQQKAVGVPSGDAPGNVPASVNGDGGF